MLPTRLQTDAAKIIAIADQCFPGRRIGGPAHVMPSDPESDVRRLWSDLPGDLGEPTLYRWMDQRGMPSDRLYRQEFRRLAILLGLAGGSHPLPPAHDEVDAR